MPPGGLRPSRVPQFVLFTHDDAVDGEAHRLVKSVTAGRAANGCPLTATMFISSRFHDERTDCGLVRDLFRSGYEIADHSLNHPNPFDISQAELRAEMANQRAWLARGCGIPAGAIVGWRTPYLKVTTDTRQLLHSLGFLYDTSLVEPGTGSVSGGMGARLWPFNMAYGNPINCNVGIFSKFQKCSRTERYPGMWQVPLWELTAAGNYWMDYGRDGANGDVFNILKANFDAGYGGNRAPFPIFVHSPFLKSNLDSVTRFVDYARSLPHVYFVTMRQLIGWMKNPIPIDQLTPTSLGCSTGLTRQSSTM
ncbi:hypothetical protein CHLNCDRAFT_138342 [Chlorella variabilis]|uniref:NodB homology domain-containing protein n=1 Tax=Chlorella variabilis TaxID=554065 RepID=E1ZMU3_CHLVA|nr:hypothetical protein CHLNCDRAFT_138342 [Chlorella variabilis]EFN52751.1 hypothetical protein CHLNCDRAFT_138342 [Chlorella variabilis]|eukprot:XP_005844853.1 hypothetical protein CHLNCDRAFT_138342 [Chlorella variabilis]